MSSEVEATPTTTSTVPGSTGVESDKSVHDSEEYESAEEIEGEEYEDELGVEEEELEEIEVEVEEEVDDEDEDGENDEGEKDVSKIEKPLDDDQDRKNPQFIPKKGYFYEHDDRTGAEEGEENEVETKDEPEKPKRIVKEASDRWSHDLYDENEQVPKSNDELRTRYGYDIRTEDTAPRARRHKRYSRGPSTYTRKWEDEAAYQRPRGGSVRGRGRGGFQKPGRRDSRNYDEEFPELHEKRSGSAPKPKVAEKENEKQEVPTEKEKSQSRIKSNDSTDDRPLNNREASQRKHEERNRRDRIPEDRDTGRGRGSRRIFHGSKQFTNRNRYPERRNEEFSRNKVSEDQKSWEQKVDRLRETEKSKSPKQANGSSGSGSNENKSHKQSPVSVPSTSSSSSAPRGTSDAQVRKSVQPFTNTEYTGSASLTAKRSQESSSYSRGSKSDKNQPNLAEKERGYENEHDDRTDERGGNRIATNSGYASDKIRANEVSSRSQQSTTTLPVSETSKPKRFSSQRQRQNQEGPGINAAAPTSSTPPNIVSAPPNSGPQNQIHLGPQTNLTLVTATGQIISPGVPVSVMSGYPPGPGYYEQVQTSYDTQGYETSGSPITVVPGPGGSSVSPSLWAQHQHPAYATGPPYPSPPTGPPQMQQPYDSAPPYLAGQPQPIFAPPPHPHPQFIQDPTIINYAPPGPPPNFGAPPFHPQQFPGYPQVPPGPPEMYHSGVTYYSPQTQMQRPPPQHIIVQTQSKRTGSRLQLVEPSRNQIRPRAYQSREEAEADMYQQQLQQHYQSGAYVESGGRLGPEMETYDQPKESLSEKLQDTLTINPDIERRKKSPSPAPLEISKAPEPESWADQVSEMTPINSPIKSEGSVDFSNAKPSSDSQLNEKDK